MSYPPPRHLLRDLRVRVSREGGLWSACAPVVPEVCGADGAARASFLAALIDVSCGRTGAGLAQPGTVLTQELGVHVLRPVSAGEVCASVRVLRDGRSLVVFDVALTDEAGRPLARASMSSVKIRRSSQVDPFAGRSGDWLELALPGSGLGAPLADYAGLRPAGENALELELSPALSNGLGILHGATQVLALETAAERVAGLVTARRAVTRDLSLHFLAPGRTGPFHASAELLRESKHDCLVRAELVDRGQADALVAVGWAGIALY